MCTSSLKGFLSALPIQSSSDPSLFLLLEVQSSNSAWVQFMDASSKAQGASTFRPRINMRYKRSTRLKQSSTRYTRQWCFVRSVRQRISGSQDGSQGGESLAAFVLPALRRAVRNGFPPPKRVRTKQATRASCAATSLRPTPQSTIQARPLGHRTLSSQCSRW